ncbi:MAG TPA: hypothetical protein DFK21_01640 [Salmonella bongori]|uniref:Uncharacterized protein n=1 Tax=Salmonella bongori serovar 66:z41:- str. SA19983605 TaxID=1243617 RepID=A0A248KE00_SALBN|nr:hypothetical protein LFZ56_19750 [Salmonella bongori serovar 66:z41:- str. SA19983605]ECC9752904.1 hypothetical protein [Salmonella bongori]HAD94331.1 hypothetical protein [Salmonella bongori]HBD14282.1 hypothetical protein [Salmonella bongori]HCI32268.1 hypothetical protein [Salmonella bongori]
MLAIMVALMESLPKFYTTGMDYTRKILRDGLSNVHLKLIEDLMVRQTRETPWDKIIPIGLLT